MSQYSRNERNANAGIVVAIAPADYALRGGRDSSAAQSDASRARRTRRVGALDGIAFQRFWESRAFELGGGGYRAARASASATSCAARRRRRSAR
jgi:uncharacterized FAD-dependent dehydrogenase